MPRPDSDGARRAEHRDDEPPERHQDGSGKGHDPTVGTNDSENDECQGPQHPDDPHGDREAAPVFTVEGFRRERREPGRDHRLSEHGACLEDDHHEERVQQPTREAPTRLPGSQRCSASRAIATSSARVRAPVLASSELTMFWTVLG